MSNTPLQPIVAQLEQPERKYWVQLPNLIDDMNLDPFAFRLYVHIKRRAGDNGACWESTRNLAKCCNMSAGRVSKAKQVLVDNGLITIGERAVRGGKVHLITVIDIWPQNMATYASDKRSPDEQSKRSGREHLSGESVQDVNTNARKRSPGETKKNHIKEKPNKEEEPGGGADAPSPSLDPSTLTVKEIKTLELDEAGWTGLLEQESANKNRSSGPKKRYGRTSTR
jgi:hypothetical protein